MLAAHIITLFPGAFDSFLAHSLMAKAQESSAISIHIHDLRDFTHDNHRSVDDMPFGGGPGMVLTPGPLFEAVESIKEGTEVDRVILMTPQGRLLRQETVSELSKMRGIVVICGRYEGVDERVSEVVTDEVSIGDYILTGGELAGMVIVDAVLSRIHI